MQALPGKSRRSLRAGRSLALVLIAGGLLRPATAPAQMSTMGDCPAGNLLAGRAPVEWRGIRGDKRLATDGNKAPEGAMWNAPAVAVILDDAAAELTYDLGALVPLQALYIQADANDTYHLWASADGKDYRSIGEVGIAEGVHGLRSRQISLGGTPVRFLRFGEGVGDNAYSVSELQAFCQLPTPFPPHIPEVAAPPAQVATNFFTYWNNEVSAGWEFVLALLGLALLYIDLDDRKAKKPRFSQKVRDRALMILGGLSLLTYFNFGFFHFPNWIHDWEWTHYYVGSKYFKELSYPRLYECIAVADHESPDQGLQRRVELRKLTNLGSHNQLETTKDILEHPERCKQHFSEARWEDFKHDVKYFRDRQSARRWDDLQTDHGYNATPVWNIAGSLLANLAPAGDGQLYTLALLDPLYLLAMVALCWWAFGWRVTAVGLLVFATNFPSRYYWTGGSFLRWDWLFYLVAGICLLKKEKPIWAGVALGYATLLRVFPVFVFAGPLLAGVIELVKLKRWNATYLRFGLGALLSLVVLVPMSLAVSGTDSYGAFIKNTQKHSDTALTNYMGLRTIVAYRPSEVGRKLKNEHDTDPWGKWKDARVRAFKQAKPLYALLAAAYLGLLGFAVWKRAAWQAAALGATFIAIGPVELTCYYYAFVMGVALLHHEDERVGRIMLMMTAAMSIIYFHPVVFMPDWLDEQYTLMSVVTVLAFGLILWNMGLGPWLASRRPAKAAPAGTTSIAVPSAAAPAEDSGEREERGRRSRPSKKRKRR